MSGELSGGDGDSSDPVCDELAETARRRGVSVATAESLTAGNLAARLGRALSAGSWYHGGIVAYSAEVKHKLLDVAPGPVVSESAARTMSNSIAAMMEADIAIAVTGEAGPQAQEDERPGTVCLLSSTTALFMPRSASSRAGRPAYWQRRSTDRCNYSWMQSAGHLPSASRVRVVT